MLARTDRLTIWDPDTVIVLVLERDLVTQVEQTITQLLGFPEVMITRPGYP